MKLDIYFTEVAHKRCSYDLTFFQLVVLRNPVIERVSVLSAKPTHILRKIGAIKQAFLFWLVLVIA